MRKTIWSLTILITLLLTSYIIWDYLDYIEREKYFEKIRISEYLETILIQTLKHPFKTVNKKIIINFLDRC